MGSWTEGTLQEARYALRALSRGRGLTAAVVVTLAVGIGVNAGMYDLVHQLFLSPPAFVSDPDATHRVYVEQTASSGDRFTYPELGYPTFRDIEDGSTTTDALVAHFTTEMVVGRGADLALESVTLASGAYWSLFDATPALGRFFGPDEDRLPSGAPVAVLSYGYWVRALGADPSVLGTDVRIGSVLYTVVGVAPAGFRGLDLSPVAAWVPMTAGATDRLGPDFADRPFTTWLTLALRRRASVPAEDVRAEVERLLRASVDGARDDDYVERVDMRVVLGPVLRDRGPMRREVAAMSLWLLGMGVLVLAIACLNIANLLLTRALDRLREQAVRAALGARGARFAVRAFLDAALLAVLGGAVAVPMGFLTSRVLTRLLLPEALGPDAPAGGVVWGALLLVPAVGLLTAVVPAARAARVDLAALMASGGRASTGGQRVRSGLMVGQAALSAVLLVAAGLFLRSLHETARLDLGYDADRILVVDADTRGLDLTRDELASLYAALEERARTTPGVAAASLTGTVPFWRNSYDGVRLEDGSVPEGRFATHWVGTDYFRTTGTGLVRGRLLDEADRDGGALVVVVSDAMERRLWGAGAGLGQCLRLGGEDAPCREVVGIVENIRRGDIRDGEGLQYYVPAAQYRGLASTLLVRASDPDAPALLDGVRRSLAEAAPAQAFLRVERLSDRVRAQTRSWTVGAQVLGGLGALAVGLAGLGLFSLLAYDVRARARELGIRVALGSTGAGLVALVLRRGVGLTLAGLVAGLTVAYLAAPRVEAYLFEIPARDPLTFVTVATLLAAGAVVAGLLPASRAARVDTVELLTSE